MGKRKVIQNGYHCFVFHYIFLGEYYGNSCFFFVKFQCIVRFRVRGVSSWYVWDENLFCPFSF